MQRGSGAVLVRGGCGGGSRMGARVLLTHCVELRGVEVERRCSDIVGSWGA